MSFNKNIYIFPSTFFDTLKEICQIATITFSNCRKKSWYR